MDKTLVDRNNFPSEWHVAILLYLKGSHKRFVDIVGLPLFTLIEEA